MKIFLIICLVSGLASSEKLDRSYLPPPGSKYSGGSLGDVDVPLEFPKQTPTGRPQENGKPEIELGVDQRPALIGTPDSQKTGFTYFQNSYPVPKTTTSYAITQTTTFPAGYDGLDQPNTFLNTSSVETGVSGQNYQQPIRGPGQGPRYNQYRPGLSQSTVAPYGTTARPPFPNDFNGLEYLPPVSNKQSPGQVGSNQDGSGYATNLPQQPKYQDGISVNQPGFDQQNQYVGNQNLPTSVAPQYQNERFGPTGPGSQPVQKQFIGNQFPSSTAAPQYQTGQRFTTPGSNQQNQILGNQDYRSSTSAPQFQTGQGIIIPGLNQPVFGSRVPSQHNQYTGSQYQGNQFPSSTGAPTPGSIQQNQYPGNENYPSTAAPIYQDGQRFTTPGQIQGGLVPGQQPFGSRVQDNQYPGNQNLPSSTVAPQFQDGQRFTTPGYVQEGYGSSVPPQESQYQYPGRQNIPSSTTAPQYQSVQQFTTVPGDQNFPLTADPNSQNGQRYTTPGQYQGQLVPQQQFGTPGQRQPLGNQNYPSSTVSPQYQDSQRLLTTGSQQIFGSPQQNQYGNQNFPTSTAAPQYQDQRFSTHGLFKQPSYPGSTAAPQYQQTFTPIPGINQQGVPNQQNQYQRPIYNQQFPSSTATPQRFIPGSQPQFGSNIPTPGTEVAFPKPQGLPGSENYESNQQPGSQTKAGSIYDTAPSFSNQGIPSTTTRTYPAGDFASTPGLGTIGGRRPERPQAEGDRNAEILSYENVLTPEGYFYSYDTSNGIHADETGEVGNGTRAQGGFTYTGDDGKVYSVVYTADENGFKPRGDHLPTPPPIPEAIQRIIDQANLDRAAGIDDDGSYNEEKYGYMKYEGPLTRFRPKNRTVSLINGADIPERNEDGIDGQNRKVFRPKGSRPSSKAGSTEVYKPDSNVDKTDINKSDLEEDMNDDDYNQNNNKEGNRHPSAKRPKPITNLTVEDNRPNRLKGIKTPMKPDVNFNKDNSSHRQIASGEYEDKGSDVEFDEPGDNDDLQDSDEFDFDSDFVNYRDDPNNRTDFHGLNKYLPETKKTNRKKQSGKKRPIVRVDGIKKPVTGISQAETSEDRYDDESQDNQADSDGSRTRLPSRKNKFGQKAKDQFKIFGQPIDSEDENNTYDDDKIDTNEEYDSDDVTNRKHKPATSKSKNKISGKPKGPTANQQQSISNNKENESSSYEETGYEYTPPQRKFGSEEATKFPFRTNQKGVQTTVRPLLPKNTYGDDEPTDEYIDQYGNVKPGQSRRPMAPQKYPGNQGGNRKSISFETSHRQFERPQTTATPQYQDVIGQEGESYNPELNQNQGFSTTRRPVSYGTSQRPFGRPQSTVAPQYQDQAVVTSQVYNEPSNQGSERPGDKLFYNTNAQNRGTVGNVFSTTTPLPPSGPDSTNQRPGQYQNRPTNVAYYETTSPSGETYIRPGSNRPGQLPSTTYRPNYSFGDKTSPVAVDSSGRPIQSTNTPSLDRTLKPVYSVRPNGDSNSQQTDRFRPNVGRFGVTSVPEPPGYQSTSAPIGEDFSGPKQLQRFDPQTGYHYK